MESAVVGLRISVTTGGLSHAYGASFTVADATTPPFRAPISRNATRGLLGFNTTVTILAVLRQGPARSTAA